MPWLMCSCGMPKMSCLCMSRICARNSKNTKRITFDVMNHLQPLNAGKICVSHFSHGLCEDDGVIVIVIYCQMNAQVYNECMRGRVCRKSARSRIYRPCRSVIVCLVLSCRTRVTVGRSQRSLLLTALTHTLRVSVCVTHTVNGTRKRVGERQQTCEKVHIK